MPSFAPCLPVDFLALYDRLLRATMSLDVLQLCELLDQPGHQDLVRQAPAGRALLLPELCAQDDEPSLAPATAEHQRLAVMNLLLAAGADPNAPDTDGMTPLAWAALHNRWGEVQRLVVAGGDPYRPDADGDTLLDNLLQDEQGPAALDVLMGQGFAPERLILNGTFDSQRLFQDRRWPDEAVLGLWRHLIGQGCSFKADDSWSWTVHQGWARCAEVALSLGANPRSTWMPWNLDLPVAPNGDRPGPWNALHQAAYEGHAHLLPRLLDLGLTIDQADAWGLTPLHAAVLNPRPGPCAVTVIQTLLNAGARSNVQATGLNGATPMDLANAQNHPGRWTLEAHALHSPTHRIASSVIPGKGGRW